MSAVCANPTEHIYMYTLRLHLVPSLKMSGAIPLLPLYAFMTCTVTALPLRAQHVEFHC